MDWLSCWHMVHRCSRVETASAAVQDHVSAEYAPQRLRFFPCRQLPHARTGLSMFLCILLPICVFAQLVLVWGLVREYGWCTVVCFYLSVCNKNNHWTFGEFKMTLYLSKNNYSILIPKMIHLNTHPRSSNRKVNETEMFKYFLFLNIFWQTTLKKNLIKSLQHAYFDLCVIWLIARTIPYHLVNYFWVSGPK